MREQKLETGRQLHDVRFVVVVAVKQLYGDGGLAKIKTRETPQQNIYELEKQSYAVKEAMVSQIEGATSFIQSSEFCSSAAAKVGGATKC